MILSKNDLKIALTELTDWQLKDGKLHRVLVFKNFIEAFGFMSKIAIIAEKINHHPDWSNSYKTITINLTTHEKGGITKQDIDLAKQINATL